jgi:hypothetical protein
VGATKALVGLVVLGAIEGLEPNISVWIFRLVGAACLGAWLLPAVSVALATRERFQFEQEFLLDVILDSANADEKLTSTVNNMIQRSSERMNNASADPALLARVIRDIVSTEVRPLSHEIWELKPEARKTFSWKNLVVLAITQHRFPALAISLSYFVTVSVSLPSMIGWPESLLRSFVGASIIWLVLSIARKIHVHGRHSGPLVFWGAITACAFAVEIGTFLACGMLPGISPVTSFIIVGNSLAIVSLVFGLITVARTRHREIRNELVSRLHQRDPSSGIDISWVLRHRKVAHYLHAEVQNRMLATAIWLDAEAGRLGTEIAQPATLDAISQLMQALSLTPVVLEEKSLPARSLDEILLRIVDQWKGIMLIHWSSTFETQLLAPGMPENIGFALEEGIGNAHRHGFARSATIKFTQSSEHLSVSISDDGTGPRGGSPGLGTSLYEALTMGNWSLAPRVDGKGSLLSLDLPLVAG